MSSAPMTPDLSEATAEERASKFLLDTVPSTVGTYLARRMIDIGVKDYFVVPGDYNLILLDEILRFPNLRLVSCCNELNAGYAADGYARATGVAVMFVTFTVGSLSAINAIAGAYSQDLPVVCISGGPNRLDYGSDRILHHTTGEENRLQELLCLRQVTTKAIEIRHVNNAPAQIDLAFSTAIREKKPVFLSISCNIATEVVSAPIPFFIDELTQSNPKSLKAALNCFMEMWKRSVNPCIVVGIKVKSSKAFDAVVQLSTMAKCATATMADAKGIFPESHSNYVGHYWGQISSPCCDSVIDSSDFQIYIGPVFNDYNTVGYTSIVNMSKIVRIGPNRVRTPTGEFGCVYMAEFCTELAKIITPNETTMKTYVQQYEAPPPYISNPPEMPLMTKNLAKQIQDLLSENTCLIVETGDSWFHGQKMKLPKNCSYEFQMQYGSIGWSVGAVLGYSMATKGKKRVVAMIGDGSFQCTAMEVSTMIRYELDPIIFLLNNQGYTIEVEIHDGIYNQIQNWDYKAVVESFGNGSKNFKCWRVGTEEELIKAVEEAKNFKGLCFIECLLDKNDCAKELLVWGTRVALANGRRCNTF